MSTAAPRKSSLGARRGGQKAYIPFRGDNPAVGKKTGVAIRNVERKSDGFEPFEELMNQADDKTPPKPKGKKKRYSVASAVPFDDVDGEMSMDLDSPVPRNLYTNAPPPVSPTSYRSSTSARIVSHSSAIDFDEIPSPRRGSSRINTQSHRASTGPGPSRLSEYYNAPDIDQDDPMDDYGDPPLDDSPRRTSFAVMDKDEDGNVDHGDVGTPDTPEDQEEEQPSPVVVSKSNKGKGKLSVVPEVEPEVEDEIAAGLADIQVSDNEEGEDEGGVQDPSPRPNKKAKLKIPEPQKPRVQSRSGSKKENRPVREGVRRSKRAHYAPLEWWRGEKLVYGRNDEEEDGPLFVAPIKEIMRIPKDIPVPLGKRKRGQMRQRSKSHTAEEKVKIKVVPVSNPEEGWDDGIDPHAVVIDFITQELVERRIAWTAEMVNPQKVTSDDWSFQKIFGDGDFIAAGILVIPAHCRKPSKATKDNTYIFMVVEGAINLKVHESSRVLATGSMFMVPRGNTYFIENIAERDAKLFFTQARKVPADDINAVVRPTSVRPPDSLPHVSNEDARETRPPGSKRASSTAENIRGKVKAPVSKRAASTRV